MKKPDINKALMQKALNEIKTLRSQVNALKEPVAIIGIGCRFPGMCQTPDEYFQLLSEGVDAISEVPGDRFAIDEYYDPEPGVPGKIYTKYGGFIGEVNRFDNDFFEMTPREVLSLDPQQRVLMEVAWEALENANIKPDALYNTQTGVYIGMSSYDFMMKQAGNLYPKDIDAYFTLGNAHCVASGRISYFLGLTGPCMTVDTACSSSLMSVHLACQSLRQKECHLAIAGGINLILSPEVSINFSRAKMLSKDGRCKTFDNSADGYGRGEGCGIIILKRLQDAIADNNDIIAVIKGSATNQDGPSSGITVPNGPSQQNVINNALNNAGISPDQVSYIEAHGTGTSLGDPIEIRALASVFKNHKKSTPLIVGSVKTNIGHLEAASGIASLIKVALSIKHKIIPKHLHLKSLNQYIDWQSIPIHIPTESCDWPKAYERRIAGISSFGFSGSNVHMILEEPTFDKNIVEKQNTISEKANQYYIFTLSAKNKSALNDLKNKYLNYLQDVKNTQHLCPESLSYTSIQCRSHFQYRMSIIFENIDKLVLLLKNDNDQSYLYQNKAVTNPPIAFLFTGQGSQYSGMGKILYQTYPVFRDVVNQCCDFLKDEFSESILDVMGYTNAQTDPDLIHNTVYTQTTLFIFEYALARLWKSWGLEPEIVMGHSIGEYVAACIAGIFSLDDGLKLVVNRAKLMQELPKNGEMAAVFADINVIYDIIDDYTDVAIAAINGPKSIVLSGKKESISSLKDVFKTKKITFVPLNVSHAFHSPLMAPMLKKFEQIASTINYNEPQLKIVSNTTGKIVTNEMSHASYWTNHIKQPVQFYPSIKLLFEEEFRIFLEIGPKSTLSRMGSMCFPDNNTRWLASIMPDNPMLQLMKTVSELYVNGVNIHWKNLFPTNNIKTINLPSYAFQRKKYWLKELDQKFQKVIIPETNQIHPLIKNIKKTSLDDILFEAVLNIQLSSQSYITHHKILDNIVFPASGFIELIIASANEISGGKHIYIEDFSFDKALFLDKEVNTNVQISFKTIDDNKYQCTIYSKSGQNEWLENAHCFLSKIKTNKENNALTLKDLQSRISSEIIVSELYNKYSSQGLNYGNFFQAIEKAWGNGNEVLGKIQLSKELLDDSSNYYLHPIISDNCFQLIQSAIPQSYTSLTYLPVNIKHITFYNKLNDASWGYVHIKDIDQQKVIADLVLFDNSGSIAVEIIGFTAFCVTPQSWLRLQKKPLLYDIKWRPVSIPDNTDDKESILENFLICSNTTDFANQLRNLLELKSIQCSVIHTDNFSEQSITSTLTGIVYYVNSSSDHSMLQQEIQPFLNLIQVLGKMSWNQPPCLWIITKGAHWIENITQGCNPFQTALWGLGRVLALEFPELRCSMIDLDPLTNDLSSLVQIILSSEHENQITVRDGKYFVPRLLKYDSPYEDKQNICLKISEPGSLDHLYLNSFVHTKPEVSEIEISVRASGLNFRDVLHALGMIKLEKNIPFGFECSGVVSRVGPDVKNIKAGQSVIAVLAPGSMADIVNVKSEFVYPMPDEMSFESAATLPLVFLTAWYSLCHLAKMKENETILIHAASGGVGLAAVQIAKLRKANIIATASNAKKQKLHEMGIKNVFNSRTLDFAEQVMQLTHNEGVDIVLNSLTGEYITKSLNSLKKGGRFIEIGKIGILSNKDAYEIRPDIDYFSFDLGKLGNAQPDIIQQMFKEMMPEFEKNNLSAIPYKTFTFKNIIDAFRYMAQARHFGKVLISMQENNFQIHSNATYIITGGTGALGQILTKWLVENGAGCIVLISRHASVHKNSDPNKVIFKSCDISCEESVKNLFNDIQNSLPPLKGIIHAAGVLDDCSMMEQSWERFENVIKPKIWGTLNLHKFTQNDQLDFFVMFSSTASLLGNAGQSNYAFANAFLDGFAQHRRSMGWSGTSINWGPWGESGMSVSLSKAGRHMTDKGIKLMSPDDAITSLEMILNNDLSQTCAIDIDWETYGKKFADSSLITELYNKNPNESSKETKQTLNAQLSKAQPEQREQILIKYLQKTGKKIAGYEDDQDFDINKPLIDAGFDSLMAVEFRNILNKELNKSLPTTLIFDYPTMQLIAEYILDEVLMLQQDDEELSEKDVMKEIEILLE